jgi:hypothetical protein
LTREPLKRAWSEAEIVVLCAVFVSTKFSSGDDERPECKAIARAFNRSPGTIDRQWRNVKDYLANMPCLKVGGSVKYWTDIALTDPALVKRLALYYCSEYGWAEVIEIMEQVDGKNERS